MFFTACGPRRPANCVRYKLRGVTALPGESIVPSGSIGPYPTGRGASLFSPTHPISQFTAPGGFCTM